MHSLIDLSPWWQGFFLGIMVSLTPSMVAFLIMLRYAPERDDE